MTSFQNQSANRWLQHLNSPLANNRGAFGWTRNDAFGTSMVLAMSSVFSRRAYPKEATF